jgi:hypothetical protein
MIYHAAGKGQFTDTGIALTESPNTQVYNNTIFMQNDFPWAIDYRFSSTKNVQIINNLTNKSIINRDGGSGTVTKNITNSTANWFINPSSGDLHLATSVSAAVDAGQLISGLSDDFDSQSRPQGPGFDIGADEFSANIAPQPPKNLHIVKP